MFTWRRASLLGRGSPSKRAGFHLAFTWEKPALLPGMARLVKSPGLTTFIFPRNLESVLFYILHISIIKFYFIIYILHINKQSL